MKKHDTRQKVDYKALSQLIYNLYRNLVTQFCTSVSYLLDVYYEHKDKKEFGKIRQSKKYIWTSGDLLSIEVRNYTMQHTWQLKIRVERKRSAHRVMGASTEAEYKR